jgi:hypothetical protein
MAVRCCSISPLQAALAASGGPIRRRLRYVAARAKEDFGLARLLVRPDGIVAWASSQPGDRRGDAAAAAWL